MEIDKNKVLPFLWIITVLFYLLRSVIEPLKYLFLLSFGLLIVYFSLHLFSNFKRSIILRYIWITKEFHIIGLFLVSGIILSSHIEILSVKSSINFLAITVLYLIYFEFRKHIQINNLLKGWIILTLIVGFLGLLKWLNFVFEINHGLFSGFYKYGSSLVSEYNFYAYYFIIAMVVYFYALDKEILQRKVHVNLGIVLLLFLNTVLSGSRRGIIVLFILVLVSIGMLVVNWKKRQSPFYKNIFWFNTLIFCLLLLSVLLIPFRSRLIQEKITQAKITTTVYRYSTIFIPNITYKILYDKLWPKNAFYEMDKTDWGEYASFNNIVDSTNNKKYLDLKNEYWLPYEISQQSGNLLYNGTFNFGKIFWEVHTPDSIKHEIINTEYGNAVRVSRFDGQGNWPLAYTGREIFYHEGVAYSFKFKFRVIKGNGVPFKIGWWINEGKGFKNNLPYKTRKLGNGWYEFTATYKFRKNQHGLRMFMNSQLTNTVVDFADIKLVCDDSLERPRYLDQITNDEGTNLLYNSNFEHGLKFWSSNSPELINHELIESPFGKAVRVSRNDGIGYWQLVYKGRDIFYYRGLTYKFRFKFRVIEGGEVPFNIGWWLPEENKNPYNLDKNIILLNEGWFGCTTSYTFSNDYYGDITMFMNSQLPNTIIDFADIELLCNDTLNRSMYADEKMDLINELEESRVNQQLSDENATLLSDRVNRWKYALQIWSNEYTWNNKLFGGGFDYLRKFGKKFYPEEDRIDYPHNPIISSFLYSGIIGGLFYIYFLVLSFWYYWKYRKHHLLFFILYLIIFAFVFISSDSHFNVPIFAMLSLVPFITKYVVKEKEQKNPV